MTIFIGIMTVMLLAIWLVDNVLMEPYYTDNKIKVMETAYDNIDAALMEQVNAGKSIDDVISSETRREWEIFSQLAKGRPDYTGTGDENDDALAEEPDDSDDAKNSSKSKNADGHGRKEALDEATQQELENSLTGRLRSYSEKNNITIILIDSETGKTLVNFGKEGDFLAQKLQQYILDHSDNETTDQLIEHENYVIERNSDRRSGNRYLESWGYFSDNNTLFLMRMPLSSIRESVYLTNRFVTGVVLLVLFIGCIIMYFVARRVTDPILKLAAVSERMSNLDFTAAYEGDAEDEIGVLGRSMNAMSEKLEETIQELQEANEQLQKDIQKKIEIDDMRKEFIANVSHELKTPIALISGYAEGLTEGMAEDEESRNYYCEVIMDEANKMNKMVKQLLTLTALEFGNDMPVLEHFDLAELIRDLLNSASILADQKDARVEFNCSEPVYVCADEFKIEEVVTNYFNNAMNHLDGEHIIRITIEKDGDLAKVTVFNTGNHIPEESIPNLWTKFYKVDKARTRAYGGSGIGLSIVKAIMDAHHQTCGARNVEGGVEFWFTLALAQEEASEDDV
jgi:signal transduction histidine kinase